MMDESEREAFERWYATKQESFGTGALTLALKTARMDAWLARAALAQPEPEPVASIRWPYELMWHTDKPPSGWIPCYTKPLSQPEPELPAPHTSVWDGVRYVEVPVYTADQVRAAILADRKRREG